jgi:RHS repeat-associated protein
MTDASGNKIETAVYTAFGERLDGDARRFAYAGTWGYQADVGGEMPFLHLGYRYYSPATGRFLQRDPIGTLAGFNLYTYVDSAPSVALDPYGLQRIPVKGVDVPSNYRGHLRWPQSRWRRPPRVPRLRPNFRLTPARGGAVGVTACIGFATGYGIAHIKIKKKPIKDRIGDALYNACPGCWNW